MITQSHLADAPKAKLYEAILRSKMGGRVLIGIGKNLLKHNFCSFVIDSKNKIQDECDRNAWSSDYEVTLKDFNIEALSTYSDSSRDQKISLINNRSYLDDVKDNNDIDVQNSTIDLDKLKRDIKAMSQNDKDQLVALGNNYFMQQDYYKQVLKNESLRVTDQDMKGKVAGIDIVRVAIKEEELSFKINMYILEKILEEAPEFRSVLEETNDNGLCGIVSNKIKRIVEKMMGASKNKKFAALLGAYIIVLTGKKDFKVIQVGM